MWAKASDELCVPVTPQTHESEAVYICDKDCCGGVVERVDISRLTTVAWRGWQCSSVKTKKSFPNIDIVNETNDGLIVT